MDFNNWYVILVLTFAAGFTCGKLWDEAWHLFRQVFQQIHNHQNGNHHSPKG